MAKLSRHTRHGEATPLQSKSHPRPLTRYALAASGMRRRLDRRPSKLSLAAGLEIDREVPSINDFHSPWKMEGGGKQTCF